jgi:cystathionine beta-lyase/cystathionine gamma-synthase
MKSSTLAIHAGTIHEKEFQPVNSPIFQSTTAYYTHDGECQYPRYYNMPAQAAVVEKIAALEGAETGMLYASGMSAIAAILTGCFRKGDHLIFQSELYGGTHHFIQTELPKYGIEFSFIDISDRDALYASYRPNTKGIYIETPSNPLLKIIDLEAIAGFAQTHGLLSIIDNTFASPINQNPIKWGIDLVMHSGTKYLGGHSDLIFGVVVGAKKQIAQLKEFSVNFGPCINGATCGLIERSIKTLGVRIDRHNSNALWLAEQLRKESFIDRVFYPGLSDHPGHALAKKQMNGFGGMLSFELKADENGIIQFMENLRVIKPAVSLGGVESLLTSPRYTSHVKIGPQGRLLMGIRDNLLRLSVGIEDAEDLLHDIQQAAQR